MIYRKHKTSNLLQSKLLEMQDRYQDNQTSEQRLLLQLPETEFLESHRLMEVNQNLNPDKLNDKRK